MHERATLSCRPAAALLTFCAVQLPEGWDGQRTVRVTDDQGHEAMMTVEAPVRDALRRAALLAPHGLCQRLDLGVDSSGLNVVEVYWES
ncbi:hypothetical protein [Deinococcus cavernae]|nr:hypothetical protein [Deinococcus cavernae]